MSSTDEKAPSDLIAEARKKRREKILEDLRRRIPVEDGPGCFLCALILRDIEMNATLTGYPRDYNGGATFPRAGKIDHLRLEGMLVPD